MKEIQYILDVAGLNYEDLRIHQNLELLEGLKMPMFDTFVGTGTPLVHITVYFYKLVGVGRDEAVLIWLFSQCLSGEALELLHLARLDIGPS